MGSHIFLTGKKNFKICLERGVYGGIDHHNPKVRAEVIAGFKGIREGDFVFFYVKREGIYGLWKVSSGPFYDETTIWEHPNYTYPYRVCIEPALRHFPEPVQLSDVYDLRDKGKIWAFDLGIITKKSHYAITTDESKEIIRLLLRNNPISESIQPVKDPYQPKDTEIPISYETTSEGFLQYEGYLNAWFMSAFAKGALRSLIGGYRDYLSYVPTSFNTVMDIFLTHATRVEDIDILHKFTCIELKTGVCDDRDLEQIVKYENWLTRRLAAGDSEMIQSILVGYDFGEKVLDYVQKRRKIENKTVRLVKYRLNPAKNDVVLSEIRTSG